MPKLGLSAGAGLDEAEAALGAWGEAPDALARLAREERRIAGMQRDNADFEKRITDLLSALAQDLEGFPFEAAAKMLHERAQAAATVAARREDCVRRLGIAANKEKIAKAALTDARSALASLMTEARLDKDENLTTLLARLDARSALEKAVRDKRDELLRAADGFAEEAIRAELSSFSAELAEQRLSELEGERARLDHDGKEAFAALDREERHKKGLETGIGAEVAAQMRRNAEAELVAAAREWAVLKLGALLLGTAIERHREASQNPLLARAGDLFRALTGGAFAGLASIYDEDDRPVLVGKRVGGESIKIDGLSEGTRDQLYLALRLAYVESYAAKLRPAALHRRRYRFVTFDDEADRPWHRGARRHRQASAMPPLHPPPPDSGDRGRPARRKRRHHRAIIPQLKLRSVASGSVQGPSMITYRTFLHIWPAPSAVFERRAPCVIL